MPHRPRILVHEYPLHIVQREIIREPCVFAEEDYQCHLHWVEEVARDCGCTVHAYALMTNHVHLLLTPARPGAPSRLMQSLGRRYVQYANRQYRRTGSLWGDATSQASCRPKATWRRAQVTNGGS